MFMTIAIIGGGAWLINSLINKSMAKGTQLFGKYPINSVAIGGGIIGLLTASMFGPLAPLVTLLSAATALGGTASVLGSQGVKVFPEMKIGGAFDVVDEDENLYAL